MKTTSNNYNLNHRFDCENCMYLTYVNVIRIGKAGTETIRLTL